MAHTPTWRRYLRFFAPDVEADVDDELRFHFEQRVNDYIARGLSRAEAEAAARERLGDLHAVEQQLKAHDRLRVRQASWRIAMDRFLVDLRTALRSLRRSPGFVATATAVLAIGIGMASAMFTVFKTVLVDQLPVAESDHVIIMHPLDRSGRHLDVPENYLAAIARDSSLFRSVAGVAHLVYAEPFMNGDAVLNLDVAGVSANYFDMLGMRPVLGRLLRPDDGRRGAPLVLVLSYQSWIHDFGSDPSIVGRSLVWLPNVPARIVGVAAGGLDYPSGTDVWRAIPAEVSGAQQVDIVSRLAPRATISEAQQALFALTQRVDPFAGVPSAYGQQGSWKIPA